MLEVRKQVTNNTNHYEKSDTRKEENVALSLKRVIEFKILKQVGPCFICVICHRFLYKSSVKKFSMNNTSSLANKLLQLQRSGSEWFYTFRTCHSKVIKNKIPCQTVLNTLSLECLPKEFKKFWILLKFKSFIEKNSSYA